MLCYFSDYKIDCLYNLECETLAAGVVKIKIEIPNKI